jgi:hypothetical protein
MKMFGLLTILFLFGAVFSAVYEIPSFPTKTENGKTGSLSDLTSLNTITPTQTTHVFYMKYNDVIATKKSVAVSDFSFKSKTKDVVSLKGTESIGIVSMVNISKPFVREVCNDIPQKDVCEEQCEPVDPIYVCKDKTYEEPSFECEWIEEEELVDDYYYKALRLRAPLLLEMLQREASENSSGGTLKVKKLVEDTEYCNDGDCETFWNYETVVIGCRFGLFRLQ